MTLSRESSNRDSRPPSRQSVQSVGKPASRRDSPARGPTPPLSAMETLASLRRDSTNSPKDADANKRQSSKSPPQPHPSGHGHQQQHYYAYPPGPPHMFSMPPPFENNGWNRMMPPPPPGDRRDSRGAESPTPGTPGYPASGMPAYQGHPHHEHYPSSPHYAQAPYPPPYSGNPHGTVYTAVQTNYTYNPGMAAYPPSYGPNGSSYPDNTNMTLPSTSPDGDIHGPGSAVNGNGFAAITSPLTHTPIPESEIHYTEDAATKVTDRIRRRCHNCYTSDTSTWRRSNLAVGKVLCNKCGLFERTHSRPRPEQFPHKRTSLTEGGDGMPPASPGYNLAPVPSQNSDTPSRLVLEKDSNAKRNKKAKFDHRADSSLPPQTIPSQNSHSLLPPLPSPLPHPDSSNNGHGHPPSLPAGLAHLTHPPQHQPYYGSPSGNSHSSFAPPPQQHGHHGVYTGAAMTVPLQYHGYTSAPGHNGYSLPPIGTVSGGQYEYPPQQQFNATPPRTVGVPVTGLLNGVDGRGRDSRESSAPFKVPNDPKETQEGGRGRGASPGANTEKGSSKLPAKSAATRSPRKAAANATKHLVENEDDVNGSKRENGNSNNRGSSPGSNNNSEYHSLSDGGQDDSGDDYSSEEDDDDDGSGAYRGSGSGRGKGGRGGARRQTRGNNKRKRGLRGSSPGGD